MAVAVDQTRDSEASPEVDDARRLAHAASHVGVAPGGRDPVLADSDRRNEGSALVHRRDLAVEEDKVGRTLGLSGASQDHGEQSQRSAGEPLSADSFFHDGSFGQSGEK